MLNGTGDRNINGPVGLSFGVSGHMLQQLRKLIFRRRCLIAKDGPLF